MEPVITVIIPIYDRVEFFEDAIKSVLAQSSGGWRLLIAVDTLEPKPEIQRIIERYAGGPYSSPDGRISVMRFEHRIHASALNQAIAKATTGYCMRLDSDDLLEPDAIRTILGKIAEHPEIGYFYGSYITVDEENKAMSVNGEPPICLAEDFSPERLEEWYISNAVIIWKTVEVRQAGFAEDLECGSDYLLALTMMLNGTKFMPIKETLYRYRQHEDSVCKKAGAKKQATFISIVRNRYSEMKKKLNKSWNGEPSDTIKPRTWRDPWLRTQLPSYTIDVGLEYTVIIPVLNHPEYTKLCLDSVVKTSANIIVVDNGSLGKTVSLLNSYGSRISIIRNTRNLGIAAALNQGVRAATTEYIAMLHNDCILLDGFDAVAKECFAQMTVGLIKLVSPLTNYSDETIFVLSREVQDDFVSNKLNNKARPTYEEISASVEKTYQRHGGISKFAGRMTSFPLIAPCPEVSSFCLMTQKSIFESVGGFCQRFRFRGCEDKELLCRYRHKGYWSGRAGFFVHHFGNITSDGPGFNFREMLNLNDEIFHQIKDEYDTKQGWTAVVFPDRDPALMARARANLLDLDWPPNQIIEIPQPGIFPIKKAWDWALPQIRSEIFGRLDADILIKRNAVSSMMEPFKDMSVAMSAAFLEDPCVGKVGHLVFLRTAAFECVDHVSTPAIDYELFYLSEIKRLNMRVEWVQETLGDHAINLDPRVVFKAYFRRGIKQRIRGLGSKNAVAEICGAFDKGPWGHLAMFAFHTGLKIDYRSDPHDDAFQAFADEHYAQVEKFCLAIVSGSDPRKPQSERDDRIRVALLADCLEIGGMEILIQLLDEMLDDSKFNLHIYSTHGGALEKSLRCKNVRIVEPKHDHAVRKMVCRRMMGWLKQDRIEVAINMSFRRADEIFASEKPCRVIERTDGPTFKYMEKPDIADLVIYESEHMKKLLPTFSCPNQLTITNGRKPINRDSAARDAIRRSLGLGSDDVLFVNVARINAIKNQQHLILMARDLKNAGHSGFKIVIMGPEQNGLKANLEALIDETSTRDVVRIFDESTGTIPILSAADVFIMCSLSEGLSGALVEAAVIGLPIISTDVGAAREVVEEWNGILTPVNDLPALVAAATRMLKDKEFRISASRASKEIGRRYSADEMIKKFERVIEEQASTQRKARDQERLTILLPCRDQKKEFLQDAINSVLKQTSPDWTLLVIVDHDTPEAIKALVCGDARIKLIVSDAPVGSAVAGALNAGLRKTETEFCCVLLSHDRLAPEAIGTLKKYIKENPEIDFFHSSRAFIDSSGVQQGEIMQVRKEISSSYFKTVGSPVKHLLCWRFTAGQAVGGMDEELGLIGPDDYDFPWKMYDAGCKFMPVGECLYFYRAHHDFYRGTVNLPVHKHLEVLRRMFEKHGVSKEETDAFLKSAHRYVIEDKQRNFEKDMSNVAKFVRSGVVSEDRKDEFLSKGYNGRHFFAHRAYCLPKAGPDGLLLSQRLCSISDPAKVREIVLFAAPEEIEEFPKDLFFDNDLIWHQQHFNRPGQIATASLTVDGATIYGCGYTSDAYQRVSSWRREHKTRIEKKFAGWPYMLYNAILNFALEIGATHFYSPTADKIFGSCIDKSRGSDREMFDAIYDRKLFECFDGVVRDGDFWKIDVKQNTGKVICLRQDDEAMELGKTICICHDIEAGLGHGAAADDSFLDALSAMLAIENEVGVKTTYNVVGCLMGKARELIEKHGHCVAFHSFDHDISKDQLQRCREVDYRIKGYRPPQSKMTPELSDENLCLRNFEWIACERGPIKLDLPKMTNGVVKIPILLDDYDLSKGWQYPEWEKNAVKQVKENYFAAICLHDCYSRHWLPQYGRFLKEMAALGKLKTMDEVAAQITFLSAQ